MAYMRDAHDPDPADEYDLTNDVFCPRRSCGSPDCEILKHPKPGQWYGDGRARCRDCGCTFGIAIEEDADEDG